MEVISVILGGGAGTRLFPLTLHRAKPAVPFGGYLRLIDIPVSNCINSGINRIFVLTQFNSESLNRHIAQTYRFDIFSRGWVDILAASQSGEEKDWYKGTADAVRRNLNHFRNLKFEHYLILAGDHIYKMDYRDFLNEHIKSGADVTISCIFKNKREAKNFGVLETDFYGRIIKFFEKPGLKLIENFPEKVLISMGIYVFNRKILEKVLENIELLDFGRNVLPFLLEKGKKLQAFIFNDYWEDVGEIKNYFSASLLLTNKKPPIKLNDPNWPFYTHPRFLGSSRIENCEINNVLLAEGSFIKESKIKNSIIGLRSVIRKNCQIEDSIIMGSDYYSEEIGGKPLGIGENCIIRKAIIDKNSYIGKNSVLLNDKNIKNLDGKGFYIRDGIIIVPKGAKIPQNSKIP